MLKAIKDHLKSKSIKIGAGAIMDAKRLSALSSTKNAKGKRDPKIRSPGTHCAKGYHPGDCPQAHGLLEGRPANVSVADAAWNADPFREVMAAKAAFALLPISTSGAATRPYKRQLYAQRHLTTCHLSNF
jgi:hypothetical protein